MTIRIETRCLVTSFLHRCLADIEIRASSEAYSFEGINLGRQKKNRAHTAVKDMQICNQSALESWERLRLCLCFFSHFAVPLVWDSLCSSIIAVVRQRAKKARQPASLAILYANTTGPPWCKMWSLASPNKPACSEILLSWGVSSDGAFEGRKRVYNLRTGFEGKIMCRKRAMTDVAAK